MAKLGHAPVMHEPARFWAPLRIGAVWAFATVGGALAGGGIALGIAVVALALLPINGKGEGPAFAWLSFMFVAVGVLALLGIAVAWAATLTRMRGTSGWQDNIAVAWGVATVGGAAAGVVLGDQTTQLLTSLPQPWSSDKMWLASGAIIAAFAAALGGRQALVLRRHVPGAAWWVGATIVRCWLVGGIAASVLVLVRILWLGVGAATGDALAVLLTTSLVAYGTALLVVGAVTGRALAVLLTTSRTDGGPAGERLTESPG